MSIVMGYVVLIINGKATIDKTPARYREDIESMLLDMGLDENGNVK